MASLLGYELPSGEEIASLLGGRLTEGMPYPNEAVAGTPAATAADRRSGTAALLAASSALLRAGAPSVMPTSTLAALAEGLQGGLGGAQTSRLAELQTAALQQSQAARRDATLAEQARQRAQTAELTRLQNGGQAPAGGPAPAPVAAGAAIAGAPGVSVDDYLTRLGRRESGGSADPNGPHNPALSSASGQFGFVNDTWRRFMRARYGSDVENLPDAEVLALRANPQRQREAATWLAEENAAVLARAGVTPTAANLAMAHTLGAAPVIALSRAAPDASVEDVLRGSIGADRTREYLRANERLLGNGRRVSDLRGEFDQQFSGPPPAAPGGAPGAAPGSAPGAAPGGPGGPVTASTLSNIFSPAEARWLLSLPQDERDKAIRERLNRTPAAGQGQGHAMSADEVRTMGLAPAPQGSAWYRTSTGEPKLIAGPGAPAGLEDVSRLLTGFRNAGPAATWMNIAPLLEQGLGALDRNNGLADTVAIYQLAKALDPTSVVRESELQMLGTSPGLASAMSTWYQRASGGGNLTDDQRALVRRELMEAKAGLQRQAEPVARQFIDLSRAYNIDPTHVVPRALFPFAYEAPPQQGGTPAPAATTPAAPPPAAPLPPGTVQGPAPGTTAQPPPPQPPAAPAAGQPTRPANGWTAANLRALSVPQLVALNGATGLTPAEREAISVEARRRQRAAGG